MKAVSAPRGNGARQSKLKRGRGTLKQPVFGVFEREGLMYTEIAPDCKRLPLQVVILSKAAGG